MTTGGPQDTLACLSALQHAALCVLARYHLLMIFINFVDLKHTLVLQYLLTVHRCTITTSCLLIYYTIRHVYALGTFCPLPLSIYTWWLSFPVASCRYMF